MLAEFKRSLNELKLTTIVSVKNSYSDGEAGPKRLGNGTTFRSKLSTLIIIIIFHMRTNALCI
jgi:hypothetical protein